MVAGVGMVTGVGVGARPFLPPLLDGGGGGGIPCFESTRFLKKIDSGGFNIKKSRRTSEA